VTRVTDLLAELDCYRPARQRMLSALGLAESNREPLAEFAEHFVAALTEGTLASSRVQSQWDVELPNGERVQVRFLANPRDRWVNEHLVYRIPNVQWYCLVLFEDMRVAGVLSFPNDLTAICAVLKKRHPRQDETLQFTRRNWWAIRDDPDRFRSLRMRVWLPPYRADR
jgi:hypothetical protein